MAPPAPEPTADAARAAEIHAIAFAGEERPWSADEISLLAQAPGGFLIVGADAFLLGRAVAPEAEILSVGVRPAARRRGLARDLLARFAARAAAAGAETAFLEVSEANPAAIALYAAAGWREAGRRRGYYRRPDGTRADALVLRLDLRTPRDREG